MATRKDRPEAPVTVIPSTASADLRNPTTYARTTGRQVVTLYDADGSVSVGNFTGSKTLAGWDAHPIAFANATSQADAMHKFIIETVMVAIARKLEGLASIDITDAERQYVKLADEADPYKIGHA